MDNIQILLKAFVTSVIAAVTVRLNLLGDLLWIFLAAVVLDYITGVITAAYLRKLSSGIGLRGIMKKVGECCVIAVALLTDDVVSDASLGLGQTFTTGHAISVIVTTWLILNELISILENISKMNIPLPPFLLTAIRLLKKQTESSVETPDSDNEP